jgi:hypothetical protein
MFWRCVFNDQFPFPTDLPLSQWPQLILFSLDLVRLPKFRYVLLVGLIVGVGVPAVVFACLWLHVFGAAGEWLLYIWPSSILLMATENMGHSVQAFGILAYSVAINVVLYVIAFSILWCLGWVFITWRLSLRDGTTI